MTIRETLQKTVARLEQNGIESARSEAEWIISNVLQTTRTEVYLRSLQEFPAELMARLQKIIDARVQGQPLQYILGYTEFYGRRFACDARALIPRPETEILLETALSYLKKKFPPVPGLSHMAWDIGTGCGNIAVTLAAELTNFNIIASDIDLETLQLARANSAANQVAARIMLINCPVFAAVRPSRQFAAICANPPYISCVEAETLPREVRDFEPPQALFAPEDGYYFLRRIIAEAKDFLLPGGLLALEIGYNQAATVKELCKAHSEYTEMQFTPDLAGHPRVAAAIRL